MRNTVKKNEASISPFMKGLISNMPRGAMRLAMPPGARRSEKTMKVSEEPPCLERVRGTVKLSSSGWERQMVSIPSDRTFISTPGKLISTPSPFTRRMFATPLA